MIKCLKLHLYPVSNVVADLIYGWIRSTFDASEELAQAGRGPVEADHAQPQY